MSEAAFGRELRVSYAKVAEFQKRGIVHFHAIIRLDGAGDGYPPAPVAVPDELFAVAVRQAVADAMVTATLGDSAVQLGFGDQIDIRPLRHGIEDQGADDDVDDGGAGPVTSGMVAAYIAKYATKAAEDFGLDSSVRTALIAQQAGRLPGLDESATTGELA